MRTFKHVYVEDPFECDFFFDENDECIAWWSCNDALWREEYMSGLLEAAGAKVVYAKLTPKLRKIIKKELGD